MDLEIYSRISTQVAAAGLKSKHWNDVVAEISSSFPGFKLFLFSHDAVYGSRAMTSVAGFDPDYLSSFYQYYSLVNPHAPSLGSVPAGTRLTTNEVLPDEQLFKTEYYSDWLMPQENLTGGGGVILGKTDTSSALFGANIRAADRENSETEWMRFLGHIYPAMIHAWNINRVIAAAEIDKHLPPDAKSTEAAVVLLRPDGYPGYVNDVAEKMIAEGRGLQQDFSGRVWISGSPAANQFVRRQKWQRKNASFEDILSDGSKVWVAELDPATLNSVDLGFTFGVFTPGVLVVLSREGRQTDPKAKLQGRYRLTPAEAEIVLALGDGFSTKEIAELRGVSPNTVRHQIKQCAAKCDVHRQTELAIIATRAKLDS